MNPYGKIIGSIVGMLVFWPYGIIVGALVGHYFLDRNPPDENTRETIENLKSYLKSRGNKLTLRHLFSTKQSFSGKIIGAVIGLAFFNISGLILGLTVGHIFLDCNDFSPDEILKQNWRRFLATIICTLIGLVFWSPFGLFAGLFVGYLIDYKRLNPEERYSFFNNDEWFNPFKNIAKSIR